MMASNSTFAVLLTILVLGGALVEAAGRPFGSWTDTSSLNNLEDVGDVEDERVTIPSFVSNYLSTLDPEKIKQYAASLEEHSLGQHSSEFCQDAKLICDSNITIEGPNMGFSKDADEDYEMFEDTGNEDQSLSFGEKDILKGQDIVFPERLQQSTYSSPSFLPHSLAEKLPFSSKRILELMDTLHISHKSKLATMMSRTVSRCQLTMEKTSKEITQTKEKEVKKKVEVTEEVKGKDSVGEEKTGKETEFGNEFGDKKRSKDKEIKEKDFMDMEFKENEIEVKKEKSSKEKEIKDKVIKNKESGWKKDEETKGKYGVALQNVTCIKKDKQSV